MLEKVLSLAVAAIITVPATAAVVAVSGDTTIPGGQGLMDAMSPYTMQVIPPTGLPVFSLVSSWATPLGAMTSSSHDVRTIGFGWGTWSHGYTGEVYFNALTSGTYTMPASTGAFDFYLESNNFGLHSFSVTATDSSGATANITKLVEGSGGAAHFGFYTTGGTSLTSIAVSCPTGAGYAWGEGRVGAVPAPGALALLGVAGLACGRRRRA